MDNILYAKVYYENGKPYGETIEEHTLNLLKNFEILKRLYYFEIKENLKDLTPDRFFWLLKTAVLYHDLGKANDLFQGKIKKNFKAILPSNIRSKTGNTTQLTLSCFFA